MTLGVVPVPSEGGSFTVTFDDGSDVHLGAGAASG